MRLKEHNKRYSYTLDHGNTIIQGIGIAIIYRGMAYMSSSTGCTQKAIGCKLDILSSKLLVESVAAIGFRSIGVPQSVFTLYNTGWLMMAQCSCFRCALWNILSHSSRLRELINNSPNFDSNSEWTHDDRISSLSGTVVVISVADSVPILWPDRKIRRFVLVFGTNAKPQMFV